ncbi:hypothetical protein BGZ75_009723, partial [Mortierella antarctica]
MADLLCLAFGSSPEPTYSLPPVSSSNQKQSSGGPNYSADLFEMSSDMGSKGGGAFGVWEATSTQMSSSNDPFGDLGGMWAATRATPTVATGARGWQVVVPE